MLLLDCIAGTVLLAPCVGAMLLAPYCWNNHRPIHSILFSDNVFRKSPACGAFLLVQKPYKATQYRSASWIQDSNTQTQILQGDGAAVAPQNLSLRATFYSL